MGRRHAKNSKNTAFTFEVAPRNEYATSRQKRRHPEEYGYLVRIPKRYQEEEPHGVKKLS